MQAPPSHDPPATRPEVVELDVPPATNAPWREGALWLLAAGLMLFTGILKGINLVIVLAYVLAGLWVVNLLLARRAVRGLSARRLPRAPVQAGIPAEWVLEVRDDGPPAGNWVLEERVGDGAAAPRRVLLVVDPWLPAKPTEADRDQLEAVLSLAAGVCKEWRREPGARLALAMGGPKPLALDGPPGPALTERLLVALALEPG